jgi:hypothetical protein
LTYFKLYGALDYGQVIGPRRASKKGNRPMNCAHCQRTNDEEAIFCVYCGVRMDAPVTPVAASRPATGATIDLRRNESPKEDAAKLVPPPAPQPSAPRTPTHSVPPAPTVTWQRGGYHPPHPRAGNNNWMGYVLLGVGLLFLFKQPWLLFIPFMLFCMASGGQRNCGGIGRRHNGGSGLVWLIGIPVLIVTGFWWPGILILIGLSALMR